MIRVAVLDDFRDAARQTADWRRVIETNLTSAFGIGREAARRLIPRGRGACMARRRVLRDDDV